MGGVNCRHCHEPVRPCDVVTHGTRLVCGGWVHSLTGGHVCYVPYLAEASEPGTLPVTGAPASKPQGERA